MKCYSFISTTIILFSYIANVLADNNYYIISIKRNDNDDYYDKAVNSVKDAIDELVNDRMNDIYDMISDNTETYTLDNGQIDEKLNELDSSLSLRKRSEGNKKFKFINKNRPERMKEGFTKRNEEDYIPLESTLVSHICPVMNYYVIKAYLSDDLFEKVKQLPDVIECIKSSTIQMDDAEDISINYNNSTSYIPPNSITSSSSSSTYYNIKDIQKETGWREVNVQENVPYHLAQTSQGVFDSSLVHHLDYTFYYPSTAGKGVDLYIIDSGMGVAHSDFDTYQGTPDERTITCDVIVNDGVITPTNDFQKYVLCHSNYKAIDHGSHCASVAAGSVYGIAKKANIHMVSNDLDDMSVMASLDYILQNGKPHKSLINISLGGFVPYVQAIQDKIHEMNEAGYVIFVSAGNTNEYCCECNPNGMVKAFSGYDGVIAVGALYFNEAERFSNYGECVTIHAPGSAMYARVEIGSTDEFGNILSMVDKGADSSSGTSLSSPITMGTAALLIAEHPEINYTYDTLKQALIDLSIKNRIINLRSGTTPNRILNNGKKIVYSPDGVYFGCGPDAGNTVCASGCCSRNGQCIDLSSLDYESLCRVENGCQSNFGQCLNPVTTITTTTTMTTTTTTTTAPPTTTEDPLVATVYVTTTDYTTTTTTFTSVATETVTKYSCDPNTN